MASKQNHHLLLWTVGLGGGGFLLYEYVYKPWAAQQAALVAAGQPTTSLLDSVFPSLAPIDTTTTPIDTTLPAPIETASPLDALSNGASLPLPQATTSGVVQSTGPVFTGPVGACIQTSGGTFTADQCQSQIDTLVAAFNKSQQYVLGYQNSLTVAQQTLAANQAALAQAQAALAQQAPGSAGEQQWAQAVAGHQTDIANLTASISGAPAKLAAMNAALAANDNTYFNLTGQHLLA